MPAAVSGAAAKTNIKWPAPQLLEEGKLPADQGACGKQLAEAAAAEQFQIAAGKVVDASLEQHLAGATAAAEA